MDQTGGRISSLRLCLLLQCTVLIASLALAPSAAAQAAHPAQASSTGQALSTGLLKLIKLGPFRQDNYRVSDDGKRVTFRYRCDLTNGTNYQLSEVDVAMAVVSL